MCVLGFRAILLPKRTMSGKSNSGGSKPQNGTQVPSKSASSSTWFALNPTKNVGEIFFFVYTFLWVGVFAILVVYPERYKQWDDWGYNGWTLSIMLPCILYPIIFPSGADAKLHWTERYATKANLWIALFNFVGNYFWTHYFFALLGAKYTFPVWTKLNEVPLLCYWLTQVYFQTYFVMSNLVIRKFAMPIQNKFLRYLVFGIIVFSVSTFAAFMETWTIQSVPYYSFNDRMQMYKVGTFFYAIYFYIGFPMFFWLDENPKDKWTLSRTAVNSLAAAMLVFIFCDFWRLAVGAIDADMATNTLPFLLKYFN